MTATLAMRQPDDSAITPILQIGLILTMLAALTKALTTAFNIGAIMTRFGASGGEAGFVATVQGISVAVAALTVPQALLWAGFAGAYSYDTLLALIGLLSFPLLPTSTAPVPPRSFKSVPLAAAGPRAERGNRAGWIALFGLRMMFFASAGLGAFIERIGSGADIALQTIDFTMFFGGLLTIVGLIGAGMVGARLGRTPPAGAGRRADVRHRLGPHDGRECAELSRQHSVWIVLPALLTPSFLGGLAVIDPSGKLNGAQPAFAMLGGSMGPMTAGIIADAGGYGGLGWFIIAVLLGAFTLMALATLRADRIRTA